MTSNENSINNIQPSPDVIFDLEKDMTVAFYNKDNYGTVRDAINNGALYHVNSCISLWGKSGVHDLIELANTMSICVGIGSYVPVIKAKNGEFYDAFEVLELVPD